MTSSVKQQEYTPMFTQNLLRIFKNQLIKKIRLKKKNYFQKMTLK